LSRRAPEISRSRPWTNLDPERRNSVLLLGGIGLVVLLVLVVIGYGYYESKIAPRNDLVLRVGEREFDYAFFERRAESEVRRGTLVTTSANTIASGITETLARITLEETLRQTWILRGNTVSDEDIDIEMRQMIGVSSDASRDIYAAALRNELLLRGLSLDEFRDIARAGVIQEKITAEIEASIPARAPHTNLGLIQVAIRQEAEEARQRLTDGEAFGAVATEVSLHESASNGGDFGWVAPGALAAEIEAGIPEEAGLSEVVESGGAFYILEARGFEEQEVSEDSRDAIVTTELGEILAATREQVGYEPALTLPQIQELTNHLFEIGG
jgi:hypothetical protein